MKSFLDLCAAYAMLADKGFPSQKPQNLKKIKSKNAIKLDSNLSAENKGQLKRFEIEGEIIFASNLKNAKRKYNGLTK